MHAEKAEECQKNPRHRIVDFASNVFSICLSIHGRDQEKINQPSNSQQAQGKKPDRSAHRFAVIKTVRPSKPKNPEQVTDQLAVRVRSHDRWLIDPWAA